MNSQHVCYRIRSHYTVCAGSMRKRRCSHPVVSIISIVILFLLVYYRKDVIARNLQVKYFIRRSLMNTTEYDAVPAKHSRRHWVVFLSELLRSRDIYIHCRYAYFIPFLYNNQYLHFVPLRYIIIAVLCLVPSVN